MEENGRGEPSAAEVRERASEMAAGVPDPFEDLHGYLDDAGARVREYAREHPWAAIGIAAGIGFVLGRLLSRT